jgi:hypothetical protein
MAWQTIDGETVLLDVDGQELLGLNSVGARVWALCDGNSSADEIATRVAAEFAAPVETVRADVAAFLDELDACGGLEWL